MEFQDDLSQSADYRSFRCNVPLKRICVDSDPTKVWKVYDAGPRSVTCPLICLPPVSGTADCYFKQILSLSSRGVRVMAVDSPPYWSLADWCEGFRLLLDHLRVDRAHLFGTSLGGYLAQKFCEYTFNCPRVSSMILCNSYTDTKIFKYTDSAAMFWMLPATVLRKMIVGKLPTKMMDSRIADSIDFMVERLQSLNQNELASRLTLNCSESYVQPHRIKIKVMVMDVFDESALNQSVKDETYKCYPEARLAHLKDGGNFPFLSRPEEVNLYIQVHLRDFDGERYSPFVFNTETEEVLNVNLT